jgi:bifunctional UDP-N-acetylglucosamine pyrophosphorylase/glucosamine-1-phosphate N-acetyltransferase
MHTHQKKEKIIMKNSVQAIILAAGKSTRFNTEKTKLAEPLCGQPMILFTTKLLQKLAVDTTVVVGYEKEIIKNIIATTHEDSIQFVVQKEQLGTGHALACSEELWVKENILVINGDMPLVTEQTIIDLYTKHQESNAIISFVTACTPDVSASKAYGRVVIQENKIAIIEAKDFIGDVTQCCCINAGIYLIKKEFLTNFIKTLKNNNANNEFYITDLIKIASEHNKQITKISAPFDTIRGINTIEELIIAEQIKQKELIQYWMNNGVRFAPHCTMNLDLNVTIGQGSYISDGVHLLGKTSIGNNVHIHPFSIINNCTIASETEIGPFAHIKNNSSSFSHSLINNNEKVMPNTFLKKNIIPHETPSHFSFVGARLVHHDIPSDEQ